MSKVELTAEQRKALAAQQEKANASVKAQLTGKYVPAPLDTDSCFEPDMGERNFEDPMHSDEHNKSVDLTKMLDDVLDNIEASGEYKAEPDNGVHYVTIKDYEIREGRNGNEDFLLFELRDEKDCRVWNKIVGKSGLQAMFDEINSENKQMLGIGTKGRQMLNILRTTPFRVYTVKDDGKNRLLTYFDSSKYNRYLYYLNSRVEKQELRPTSMEDGDSTPKSLPEYM